MSFTQTLYALILLAHILSAVAAIGGWFALLVLLGHVRREPQTAAALLPPAARIAMFPRHGGLALLLTGVLLVGLQDWALFKAGWVAASLLLLLAIIAAGLFLVAPKMKAAGGLAARGAAPATVAAAVADTRQLGVAITVAAVVILALMVVKPGG